MTEPTGAELDILKVLWEESPLSARELHQRVSEKRDWSYSTTRTHLNRMVEKGLVRRRDSHGLAVFQAAEEKVSLLGGIIRNFSMKVLDMGGSMPASAFADSELLNEEELAELTRLLEEDES
ncbi:BlaI/MecI/CopY family transcriptional regulator [Hyphobacterium sp. HN65]|uniref:BlaI/MecI/CopY family transcriptional regulator n=1 Tax=Hyphobacterium lacteum TaxID=3116575 RepID=A0ABU7LR59_9PROT|nr:BlaI/MecI/CopY family transcriptional regulator [Hyphobacterium sp. HN65]MEE2526397.1 BlaI/MecI/CopY family transcriptional regulator [Hyphobacterium sp. HN65]